MMDELSRSVFVVNLSNPRMVKRGRAMRANRKMLVLRSVILVAVSTVTQIAAETPGQGPSVALTQEPARITLRHLPALQGFVGQSDTLMPDGNALKVGGELGSAYRNSAFTVNPLTGASTELPAKLNYARAWHSATILPNGSVLVFGGIGSGGAVVQQVELLNATGTQFQMLSTTSPVGRAYHTATLLTDGRILIAGGADANGNVLDTAVLWDYRTGSVSSIQLLTPRMKHEAALLPDGGVLIWGGVDANGNTIPNGEILDPISGTVQLQSNPVLPADDPNSPQLSFSIPANTATNVLPSTVIVLRFSKPLNVSSVNANTVVLTGPAGPVSTTAVPAEGGMLVFISLKAELDSGAAYSLAISGIIDTAGQPLPRQTIVFNTSTAQSGISEQGPESSVDSSSVNSADSTSVDSTPQAMAGNAGPVSTTAASSNLQAGLEPSMQSHLSVTPVSFEQMRQKVEASSGLLTGKAHAMTTGSGTCGLGAASSSANEIVALANELNNDPDLIYQYVHDNIEFSPLYGFLKGPVGTLLDGRGDSFDQASLMVALLQQAAVNNPAISCINYEIGTINLSQTQLDNWLGIDSNQYTAELILSSAGIPHNPVDTQGNVTGMGHVWVKVSINGTPYVFDPAFKGHSWKSGIVSSLPSIMQYSQAKFLSDASPATLTSTSIQGINRTQLRNDLSAYANNLAAYIKSNLPTAGMSDVIGGGTILPTPFANGQTVRYTSNPNNPSGTPTDSSSIPSGYYATLQVWVLNQNGNEDTAWANSCPNNCTFNSSDIYGHRLSIFFNSSYAPTLYLDGTAIATGTPAPPQNGVTAHVNVKFTVLTPWAPIATNYHIQTIAAQTNQGGGSSGYIVSTGWDQVGRGMIEKHRKLLKQYIASGAASNSEPVLGESLEVLAATWLSECAAQQEISDRLLNTITQYYYGVGIAGETAGTSVVSPYVDLPLNYTNTPTRVNGSSSGLTANVFAGFADTNGVSSSFESAALEQTQAPVPNFAAVSTVKLLDMAVQSGNTIYDVNNSATGNNWVAIRNILCPTYSSNSCANYNISDINAIGNLVANGFRVIAPSNGEITLGSWTGVGYKALNSSAWSASYSELISGGLNGGFGAFPVSTGQFSNNGSTQFIVPTSEDFDCPMCDQSGSTFTGGDPLSLQKGSFQYQHNDLDVGSKSFPYGLNFQRLYDSGSQGISGPLGNGWTHNYAISAAVNSDGFAGMGHGTPLNAAASIAALYVSSDLINNQALNGQNGHSLNGQSNLENFVVEVIVNRWFTDQLTNNVVNVSQGWNTEEFVKMADGSYSSPPGSATIVDRSTGVLRYRTKSGVTMTFNGDPTVGTPGVPVQISNWVNAAGASVSFSYSGSGNNALLANVSSSATGRSLGFNYNGTQISSVSDGTGRSVSYTITGGNLTQYTDALSQNTTYSYGGANDQSGVGRLVQINYPSNPSNAFVTNFYDKMGHVFKQQDALGNTSLAFMAGTRAEIDDPAGDRHVYYNDPFGNVVMEIQDYGTSHLNATTVNTYNGQELLVSTTLPEGNSTTITAYDSLFNPLTIVQTPKPGSLLSPLTTTMTYTAPVSSLPNFEEVKTVTDPKGNVTTNSYDSTSGNLTQVQQPVVSKPGAGNQTPTENFTYTSIGLPQTVTDAEGRVTRYDYYASNPDEVQKTTVDYGRLNYVTQYTYDPYGDVCAVTDPNGNVTTSVHDVLQRITEVDAPNALGITKTDYYPDGQVHDIYREQNTPSISSPATCISNSSETSPIWETTTYTYTLSDKVLTATDPLGNVTTTAYDQDDRVSTVTQPVTSSPALYRVRISTYDIQSRPSQVSVGSGSSTQTAVSSATVLATYTYTLNGKQLSVTDANTNNKPTKYSYDGFDRLSATTYPDGSSEQFSQYDSDSNVGLETTRSGLTIGFTYDALNRVQTKTPQGETAGQVNYGYDLTGRLLQATDTTTTTPYQIGYDTAGRATSFTDQVGNNTQVAYDGAGNRTQVTWPAGTSGAGSYYVTYQYDPMNRMQYVKEGGTGKLLAQYSWDALSRAQQITYGDSTTDIYSLYDAGDNLKTMTQNYAGADNSVTFGYTWYANHQRNTTSVSDMLFQYVPQASTVSYGAADADNELTTAGSATMTYDSNHNLTYDGFNTLMYDVENRLIQAENATWCPSVNPCAYAYDPLGQRKEKVVNGTVATAFVLAGGDEIADYYASSGTWRLTVRGAGGMPLAEIVPGASEQIYYVHHDVQGSTVAITEAGLTGPAESYTYSDYGQPQAGSWSAYQYDGYRYDSETGLYYVKARYYSPALGRFMQSDPAGFRGGFNLYAYTGNDPINLADPSGLTSDGSSGGFFHNLWNSASNFVSSIFAPSTMPDYGPDPDAGDRYMLNGMMQQGGGYFHGAYTTVQYASAYDAIATLPVAADAYAAFGATSLSVAPEAGAETGSGTATISQYAGTHFSIEVNVGNQSLATEQVITNEVTNETTIALNNSTAPLRTWTVELPNGQAALDYSNSLLGTNTGTYNALTNSCLSYCGNVLNAGGLDVSVNSTLSTARFLASLGAQ